MSKLYNTQTHRLARGPGWAILSSRPSGKRKQLHRWCFVIRGYRTNITKLGNRGHGYPFWFGIGIKSLPFYCHCVYLIFFVVPFGLFVGRLPVHPIDRTTNCSIRFWLWEERQCAFPVWVCWWWLVHKTIENDCIYLSCMISTYVTISY